MPESNSISGGSFTVRGYKHRFAGLLLGYPSEDGERVIDPITKDLISNKDFNGLRQYARTKIHNEGTLAWICGT